MAEASMTPQDLLNANGITLESYAPGRYYTTCKKCSRNRSKAHQKAKCLGVTIKGDAVHWGCNHCNWTGPEKGSGKTNGQGGELAATYDYRDTDGVVLFQKVRNPPGSKTRFFMRRPDGHGGWINNTKGVDTKLLYRIDEVNEAIALGRRIAIVEGEKDANNLWAIGIPATCNAHGASEPDKKPKWTSKHSEQLCSADIVVFNDNDPPGIAHADVTCRLSDGVAQRVCRLDLKPHWPNMPEGNDVSDWLDAGHSREDLDALIAKAPDWTVQSKSPEPTNKPHAPRTLADVRQIFKRWLGGEFDMMTLDVVLAVAAAERLSGDPPWLLIISGPGNAKTETVQSLSAVSGAHVASTITSEGALLSATSKRARNKDATGGLLLKIGARGILVIKDFTSILSIDRNVRTGVLSALREVHDGRWERNVGSDGGRTLSWTGRLVIVGACTTAWDQAHGVVSTMGDRFVLIRSSSRIGRTTAGARAIKNTGAETEMRKEMADAVAGLIENIKVDHRDLALLEDEQSRILDAADIVTLARTGVETDYRGDVIDVHEPEMPTRFAKQLTQIMRGGIAIGVPRQEALALALRCAHDSVPQLRLAVLEDLKENGESSVREVCNRLQKPWRTIQRTLEALHVLDLIVCRVVELRNRAGSCEQAQAPISRAPGALDGERQKGTAQEPDARNRTAIALAAPLPGTGLGASLRSWRGQQREQRRAYLGAQSGGLERRVRAPGAVVVGSKPWARRSLGAVCPGGGSLPAHLQQFAQMLGDAGRAAPSA
jgi:hypothetical protein